MPLNSKSEEWRDIPGFVGLYQVSNLGNVKSLRKQMILKPSENKGGYLHVCLYNKCVYKDCRIHRLVAIAFIDNPEHKRTVNHKDGNKKNNCLENLEWATHSENIIHANCTGLRSVTEAQRKAASFNGRKTCDLNRRRTPVYCLKDNTRIEFPSAHDGARFVNGDASPIIRCCKGKMKSYKGYEWGYSLCR